MAGLTVSTDVDGVSVLVLEGEHDLATAMPLREALVEAGEAERSVVIELSVVSFIDSTILGVILGGLRRAKEQGRGYALVISDQSEDAVPRLLEITGLRAIFPVFFSRDLAIASASTGINAPT